jgi:hypothetical protein
MLFCVVDFLALLAGQKRFAPAPEGALGKNLGKISQNDNTNFWQFSARTRCSTYL